MALLEIADILLFFIDYMHKIIIIIFKKKNNRIFLLTISYIWCILLVYFIAVFTKCIYKKYFYKI